MDRAVVVEPVATLDGVRVNRGQPHQSMLTREASVMGTGTLSRVRHCHPS
jgi:hypothetical protein